MFLETAFFSLISYLYLPLSQYRYCSTWLPAFSLFSFFSFFLVLELTIPPQQKSDDTSTHKHIPHWSSFIQTMLPCMLRSRSRVLGAAFRAAPRVGSAKALGPMMVRQFSSGGGGTSKLPVVRIVLAGAFVALGGVALSAPYAEQQAEERELDLLRGAGMLGQFITVPSHSKTPGDDPTRKIHRVVMPKKDKAGAIQYPGPDDVIVVFNGGIGEASYDWRTMQQVRDLNLFSVVLSDGSIAILIRIIIIINNNNNNNLAC